MAKNITLAIDEDLLDKVRVLAAMKRTSVNALVRDYLEHLVESEKGKDEAREELLRLMDESDGRIGDWRPNREDAYPEEPRNDQRG